MAHTKSFRSIESIATIIVIAFVGGQCVCVCVWGAPCGVKSGNPANTNWMTINAENPLEIRINVFRMC